MKKNKVVLVAAIGMSPAVLTETVWALAHEKTPVVPDEVYAITTSTGREKLEQLLLTGKPSVWESMCKALKSEKLPVDDKLKFGRVRIVEIPDANGEGIKDLRTADDNLSAADRMLATLRAQTENPETIVYASIAGGRKSMSALMLSCMSLLGRECDHVNHVLTEPETIGMKRVVRPSAKAVASTAEELFCYPVKGATYAYREGAEQKTIAAGKIKIELFEVPFVRVRGLFREVVKEMPASYGSLVNFVQQLAPSAEVPPEIVIDVVKGVCKIGGYTCEMPETCFALLYLMVKGVYKVGNQLEVIDEIYKKRNEPTLPKWVKGFVASKRIRHTTDSTGRDVPPDEKKLSKVASDLRKNLENRLGARYVSMLAPERGKSVSYDRSRIQIVGEEAESFSQVAHCLDDYLD